MQKKYVNISDIEKAENKVIAEAYNKIGIYCQKFHEAIELLLKLNNYFIINHEEKDPFANSDICFFNVAYGHYLEAPYSLYVCNKLMTQGHYLNAAIQARSLLDFFITCKYLHLNRNHVIPYTKNEKVEIIHNDKVNKRYLSIGDMFKALDLEDFYQDYWGNVFSKITHGKPGAASYFRIKKSPSSDNENDFEMLTVPEFNLSNSFLIINIIIPIIYAYLCHRKIFFVGRINDLPEEIKKECTLAIEWTKNHQDQVLKQNPLMKDFIEGINKLIQT